MVEEGRCGMTTGLSVECSTLGLIDDLFEDREGSACRELRVLERFNLGVEGKLR